MAETRVPKDPVTEQPDPTNELVEVDCGTSAAVHELDLEGEAEQVPKEAVSEKTRAERAIKAKP